MPLKKKTLLFVKLVSEILSLRFLAILVFSLSWMSSASLSAHHQLAAKLGTGVNLGNALDAPYEGAWGIRLESSYFVRIREAGFDSIRLPVRWSAHAAKEAPYTIEDSFFERVDWALEQAEENGLSIVLNLHHYLELFEEPEKHEARFLALWSQIANRYKDAQPSVFFEPLNEPNTELTSDKWNALIPKVIAVIRKTNPDRPLVMGVANWSNVEYTPRLVLLDDDPNLILTFHYYSPHSFTHQGTPWSEPKFRNLKGIRWLGTDEEKQAVTRDFMIAVKYAEERDLPIYLGEFGAYEAADMDSRIRWTEFVADEARRMGMTVAYWEFGASFGLYDRSRKAWREDLLEAVLP